MADSFAARIDADDAGLPTMHTISLCLFRLPRSSLICYVDFDFSDVVLDSSALIGFAASVLD